jgi:quercetin dioxygenase-like cupin family protein
MNNDPKSDNADSGRDTKELDKEKAHIIVEIVEYVPNAVLSRTIIKKSTGNVVAMSISEGEELCEKNVPYDNFIQIIDGEADLKIGTEEYHLKTGSGFVIPAHSLQCFYANQRFKMISTIIKHGYED